MNIISHGSYGAVISVQFEAFMDKLILSLAHCFLFRLLPETSLKHTALSKSGRLCGDTVTSRLGNVRRLKKILGMPSIFFEKTCALKGQCCCPSWPRC